MKKIRKLVSLVAIVSLLILPLNVSANSNDVYSTPIEISTTVDQLQDGVTVLVKMKDDGTYTQKVYTEEENIPSQYSTPGHGTGADGILNWATFHVGFKNWTNYSNDFYYTITSDEPMSVVKGTAFVKSPSIFFPKTYFNRSFTHSLGGSTRLSKSLKEGVDVDGATEVVVGFQNVVMTTIAGDKANFGSAQQLVER